MSHISVPAEKVIKCCNNWKAYWNIRNCQRAANILAKKAKEKRFIIFGSPIGYQKAYEYCMEEDNFCSLKFQLCFILGETGETIKNLLMLAKHGNPVIISDKHAFILDFEEI